MLKYIFALVILAKASSPQNLPVLPSNPNPTNFDPTQYLTHEGTGEEHEVIDKYSTSWTENSTQYLTDDFYMKCHESCEKKCVAPCPVPILCDPDQQTYCGKCDFKEWNEAWGQVWPDCIKDDICVPKNCECQVPSGCEHGLCPMWCETFCEDWQIKCCGGINDCGCKIEDTCITKPFCCDEKTRCEHFCPEECGPCTFACPQPDIDCCPQPDKCEPMVKSINHPYDYCPDQHCPKCCEADETWCEGVMQDNGCRKEATCVHNCPSDSDTGVPCPEEDNCPVICNEFNEVHCARTKIFYGKYAGCYTAECCVPPARDCLGKHCPLGSASHPCPEKECPPCSYLCPARKVHHTCCLEEAVCKECDRNYEEECCSAAVTCHAVCEDHERECRPPGKDEEGCPYPAVCVPVTRNQCTGEECEPHCDGVCRHPEQTGPCLGEIKNCGCREPSFCHPNQKKKWGVGCHKDWCPGWCPKYCEEGEICCPSVEDPCNGCPTEPRCVPIATDANGNNCPDSSASHGCDIDCRTADVGTGLNKTEPGGYEVICPPLKDDAQCGCLGKLHCRTRIGWFDETGCQQWCPAHSVCDKECPEGTLKCPQGVDENGCKREPACITIPLDDLCQLPCKNFVCPPCCDEAKEKYCKGAHGWDSENSQMCPEPDYCVERKLLANGDRCEGYCKKECPEGKSPVPQQGVDSRGCPFEDNCEDNPTYKRDKKKKRNEIKKAIRKKETKKGRKAARKAFRKAKGNGII